MRIEEKERYKYLYLILRTESFFYIQLFILKSDLPIQCFPLTQGTENFTGFKILYLHTVLWEPQQPLLSFQDSFLTFPCFLILPCWLALIESVGQLKKSLEALLEINDQDLSKGLRVFKLQTQLGKTLEVLQRRMKS